MNSNKPLVTGVRNGGVLTLTLGAGPAHPLSLEMIEQLYEHLERVSGDTDVRAVILHGPGRIFCAGHDLKEIARHRRENDHGEAFLTHLFNRCGAMMQLLANLPQPTIAMVEGIATAGGLQMMASCDLVFAAPGATFCLPGVQNQGFCTTPSVAVGRSIGRKHLMEMLLSGATFDVEWALAAGLINRVVPAEDLSNVTLEFAAGLTRWNPVAIAAGKKALAAQLDLPLDEAYELATKVMIGHFMDPDRIALEKKEWA